MPSVFGVYVVAASTIMQPLGLPGSV